MMILAPLLFLAFAMPARAVTVSRLYTFEAGQKIQAAQINGELDNIISAIDGNLDGTYNLSQLSVATGNIASAAVTKSKLGALGQQISSSSGFAQRILTDDGLVPNLSDTLTVDHRPVFVGLQSAGGLSSPGRVAYRHNGGGATDNAAFIAFQRIGLSGIAATVNQSMIGTRSITSSTDDIFEQLPCSAFWFVDVPGAGPFTYSAAFRVATSDSGIVTVENCKLVVFEL